MTNDLVRPWFSVYLMEILSPIWQRRTARIIADSILNLQEQGLISCNYSESGKLFTRFTHCRFCNFRNFKLMFLTRGHLVFTGGRKFFVLLKNKNYTLDVKFTRCAESSTAGQFTQYVALNESPFLMLATLTFPLVGSNHCV